MDYCIRGCGRLQIICNLRHFMVDYIVPMLIGGTIGLVIGLVIYLVQNWLTPGGI